MESPLRGVDVRVPKPKITGATPVGVYRSPQSSTLLLQTLLKRDKSGIDDGRQILMAKAASEVHMCCGAIFADRIDEPFDQSSMDFSAIAAMSRPGANAA